MSVKGGIRGPGHKVVDTVAKFCKKSRVNNVHSLRYQEGNTAYRGRELLAHCVEVTYTRMPLGEESRTLELLPDILSFHYLFDNPNNHIPSQLSLHGYSMWGSFYTLQLTKVYLHIED